jgi:hypothetical protein
MEPRLALLRRSGAGDMLLAHVLGVHGSAIQTTLNLDKRVYVEVERFQDFHRDGKSPSGERFDVAMYSLRAVDVVGSGVFFETVRFFVVEDGDLDVVADRHLVFVGVYSGKAKDRNDLSGISCFRVFVQLCIFLCDKSVRRVFVALAAAMGTCEREVKSSTSSSTEACICACVEYIKSPCKTPY